MASQRQAGSRRRLVAAILLSMQHRTAVVPIKAKRWDAELGCHVLAVVAYRRTCTCGARSSSASSVLEARALVLAHRG